MDYILVLCTVQDKKQGKEIAKQLVSEGIAACVNIVPKLLSIYRWEGEISEDEEALMLIKTKKTLFEQVQNRILQLHTYDLPEIIAFDISDANKAYLDWISKETGSKLT